MHELTEKRKVLLNPGPGTTSQSVKNSLIVPDICPREKEFQAVIKRLRSDLVRVVHGGQDYSCILIAGSGTSVMDACINSVVPSSGKILIINNGIYGRRMVDIAKIYGIAIKELSYQSNQIPSSHELEKTLESEKDITCIAMIHHETTTGILNPIQDIGAIAKKYGKVFVVDAISSYAAIPINVKELNIDFLLSSSNKCIQGMAGIGFVIANKRELDNLKNYPKRSYYLNLSENYSFLERTGQMQFTAPPQVIYALSQATQEYFEEGGENRWARYKDNWETLRKGVQEMGFELIIKLEHQSKILMSLREPTHPDYDFDLLHDQLYEKGFTIYPGRLMDEKTLRLAVIGDLYKEDMHNFLSAFKSSLDGFGIKNNLYN